MYVHVHECNVPVDSCQIPHFRSVIDLLRVLPKFVNPLRLESGIDEDLSFDCLAIRFTSTDFISQNDDLESTHQFHMTTSHFSFPPTSIQIKFRKQSFKQKGKFRNEMHVRSTRP